MNTKLKIDRWYDKSTRNWIVTMKDTEGNQVGESVVVFRRSEALGIRPTDPAFCLPDPDADAKLEERYGASCTKTRAGQFLARANGRITAAEVEFHEHLVTQKVLLRDLMAVSDFKMLGWEWKRRPLTKLSPAPALALGDWPPTNEVFDRSMLVNVARILHRHRWERLDSSPTKNSWWFQKLFGREFRTLQLSWQFAVLPSPVDQKRGIAYIELVAEPQFVN